MKPLFYHSCVAVLALMASMLLIACQHRAVPESYSETAFGSGSASMVFHEKPVAKKAWRRSIEYSGVSANPLVVNGSCYEQCQISIPVSDPAAKVTITLPAGTTVHTHEQPFVSLQVKKTLAWMGHPFTRVSIADVRRDMGVAMFAHEALLEIKTYGAWTSMEGGASVEIVAHVPKRVRVRHAKEETHSLMLADLLQAQKNWRAVPSFPSSSKAYSQSAENRIGTEE